MPIGTYEVVSQTYTMSLRQDHAVTATKLESVAAGTVMVADDIWTAPADGNYVKAGDQWAHIVKVNGVTKNAWVAVIHMGVKYCTVTQPQGLPDTLWIGATRDSVQEYRKAAQ